MYIKNPSLAREAKLTRNFVPKFQQRDMALFFDETQHSPSCATFRAFSDILSPRHARFSISHPLTHAHSHPRPPRTPVTLDGIYERIAPIMTPPGPWCFAIVCFLETPFLLNHTLSSFQLWWNLVTLFWKNIYICPLAILSPWRKASLAHDCIPQLSHNARDDVFKAHLSFLFVCV